MTKTDLITQLASKLEITKKLSTEIINALFGVESDDLGIIAQGIKDDSKLQIIGFGNFEIRERAARKGHNPATGEEIDIPASNTVGFSAGKGLKDMANS